MNQLKNILLIYIFLHVREYMHAMASLWRSEDNLRNLLLSFYSVGRRDWAEINRFGGNLLVKSHLESSLNKNIFFFGNSYFFR